KILYKPFDYRFTFYTGTTRGFIGTPGKKVASNFYRKNIGLVLNRQHVNSNFSHCLITNSAIGHGTHYLGNKGQDYLCPLYLYPDKSEQSSLLDTANSARKPNLDMAIVKQIAKKLGLKFIPDHENKKEGDT